MAESVWTKDEIETLKDLCEHNKCRKLPIYGGFL